MDITVKHAGGQRVEAQFKSYTVFADQPVAQGGEGKTPSPFDLFLASIATCAGFYVFDFCLHRDIPVDDVTLLMSTNRDASTKMITSIDVEVKLPADFPKKYEAAVIRSVDLCAVKKHLVDPPEIRTFVTYP